MRGLRFLASLAAVGTILGEAASADAGPKVPKALAGVVLHDGATKVEIDKTLDRLGGRAVIVFRTRYRSETIADEATITESGTELAIVDVATREDVFRERIRASYQIARYGYEEITGAFEYRVSWKDEELSFDLGKASGAGPPVPDALRVWQVRYGELAEVGPEIAKCARGQDDAGTLGGDEAEWIEMRRGAVDRFVEAIDLGRKRGVVRCAYGDALVASRIAVTDALLPAVGQDWTAAPIAADCPGASWAERHGLARDPRRVFVFMTSHGLAIVAVRDGAIEEARVETFADHMSLDLHAPSAEPAWSEIWVIDEHLWFFAELEIEDHDGSHGRYAVAYDPLGDWIAAKHTLVEGQTSHFEHRTVQHGIFELIVDGGRDAKTLWSREAASWRQ